ncbi:Hpt domain-containing protein [Flavobacterium sp. ARAG 55.4]|uniref:Hpt domain-containing protein n=1 Tax=Flavobacterium sp. ARAG 55.4 TaxID=3451357 RepID=UPI003F48429B
MEEANMSYINELSGDNVEFKNQIISILKAELPDEIQQYNNHKEQANFVQMHQMVHKLKHKITILGLEKSYYLAEEYESNLKNKTTELQSEFEDVLKVMQEFVIQL